MKAREIEQANSDFALALKARETLKHECYWMRGYRLKDGRLCVIGHILQAMGAKPRDDYINFDLSDDEYDTLRRICAGLGWKGGYIVAENHNDASDHENVLRRYDLGLADWKRP